MNALRSACHQTNNRDPAVELVQQTVEQTGWALKDRGLLLVLGGAHRAPARPKEPQ